MYKNICKGKCIIHLCVRIVYITNEWKQMDICIYILYIICEARGGKNGADFAAIGQQLLFFDILSFHPGLTIRSNLDLNAL